MKLIKKEPLYRKVNTQARGVYHHFGGDFRSGRSSDNVETQKMSHGKRRGLDYTPLFKFLLSRVGRDWDDVYSEVVARLDKIEPIFIMVSLQNQKKNDFFRVGESTFYSGLYVDENGTLQIVSPEIGPDTIEPYCKCCTHTFNGKPFTKKYKD